MDMQLGVDHRNDRFKLGSHVLFYFPERLLHGCIDGRNIGTDLFHFLLGLCEIILQGIEVSFQVLATCMGHDDKGTEKGWVGSIFSFFFEK
jgi:hypothetical protein